MWFSVKGYVEIWLKRWYLLYDAEAANGWSIFCRLFKFKWFLMYLKLWIRMTLNDKIELKYNYEILMSLSFLVTMVIISIIALKNISCLEFTNIKIVGMSVLFCSNEDRPVYNNFNYHQYLDPEQNRMGAFQLWSSTSIMIRVVRDSQSLDKET